MSEVSPGGPAEKGGVKVGDVIVKFDNKPVTTMRDLPRIVAETKIDKPVNVELIRRGRTKRIKIVTGRLQEAALDKKPAESKAKQQQDTKSHVYLGLTLQNINPKSRRDFELGDDASGALVIEMGRSSVAFESGIRVGDVISEIDQKTIGSAKAAVEALKKAEKSGRNSVLVFVKSRGTVRFIAIPLGN